eukprot:6921111-Prymnesium_polylepis.1
MAIGGAPHKCWSCNSPTPQPIPGWKVCLHYWKRSLVLPPRLTGDGSCPAWPPLASKAPLEA